MPDRHPPHDDDDFDADDLDPSPSHRSREPEEGTKLGGIAGELLRKAVVTGLGAVFMTEEGLRNLAGQVKLPKEMLTGILSQADKTKSELTRVIGEEIRGFLNSELMRQELLKMLSGMTIEIKAEVRLRPDPDAKTDALLPKIELVDSSIRRGGGKDSTVKDAKDAIKKKKDSPT